MRVFFLDDDAERHRVFQPNTVGCSWCEQAYNARDAIDAFSKRYFDIVYLDHDLGGPDFEGTLIDGIEDGRFVARWISANADRFRHTFFVIHSLNYDGSMQMQSILTEAKLSSVRIPFGWKVPVSDIAQVIEFRNWLAERKRGQGPVIESTGDGS